MRIKELSEKVEHSNEYDKSSVRRSSFPGGGSRGSTDEGRTKRSILTISGVNRITIDDNKDLTVVDETDVIVGDKLVDREAIIKHPDEEIVVGDELIVIRLLSEQKATDLYHRLLDEENRRRIEEISEVVSSEKPDTEIKQRIYVDDIREFEIE